MNGFLALLRKELWEIVRTWRVWVLPGVLLFFALSGPVTARYTKEILQSMSAGVPFPIPDPTWRDTLTQWVKNVGQMGTLAVLLSFGGVISSERRQGTQILILTKPVSRAAYVLAKFASGVVLLVAASTVAAFVEHGVTLLLFPQAELLPLLAITGLWLVQAVLWLSILLIASAVLDSGLAASGVGLGAMILVALASLWTPAVRYSPAGLGSLMSTMVAGGRAEWGWPVAVTLALTGVCVAVAILVFRRREL